MENDIMQDCVIDKVQSSSLLLNAAADIVLTYDDFLSHNPTTLMERYARVAGESMII
jgi:hypothetical protein